MILKTLDFSLISEFTAGTGPRADATRVEAPAAGFRRASRRLNGAFLTIRPRLLPVSSISIYLSIGTSDHVFRHWPLDGGDVLGPTLTYLLIDKRDVPLVIDQPEENLDNQTIATMNRRASAPGTVDPSRQDRSVRPLRGRATAYDTCSPGAAVHPPRPGSRIDRFDTPTAQKSALFTGCARGSGDRAGMAGRSANTTSRSAGSVAQKRSKATPASA